MARAEKDSPRKERKSETMFSCLEYKLILEGGREGGREGG